MTLTTTVTDGYRSFTDQLAATDWTRLAAAVVAVQLATALWYLYVALFAFDGEHDIATLSLGIADLWSTVVTALIIGLFLAPVLVAAFLILSRMLPIRRVYAQTAVPWLLLGPGVVLALVGYGLYDWGLESIRMAFEAEGWEYAKWSGLWFLYTGLLAMFAGGAYALVTGSVRPTERQRRGLIVAVAVLVAVPMVAGAAFPIDDTDDSATDLNTTASASEPTPDPEEYGYQNISYGEEGSANHLLANASTDPPDAYRSYNVSETHVGPSYFDFQTIEVNDDGEWATVRGQYRIRFEGASDEIVWNEQVLNTGALEPVGATERATYGDWSVPKTIRGDVRMAGIESMWIYYDVVTRDGDVERYMVKLERSDVSSDA